VAKIAASEPLNEIAQKAAAADVFHRIDSAFEHEYGLNLATLAARYDTQLRARAQQAEEKAQQAEEKAQQAEDKAQQAEEKAQQAEDKAQQAEDKAQQAEEKAQQAEEKAQQAEEKAQQAEEKAQQAEEKAQQADLDLHDILASKSWQITRPLREAKLILNIGLKKLMHLIFYKPITNLLNNKKLIKRVKLWTLKYPYIHIQLIILRNKIVGRNPSDEAAFIKKQNDMTSHNLMNLVNIKLTSKPIEENVLYLKGDKINE
jgi:flagellar biosynthesis GTPase FlhF